jgi:L-fuculose-phosphate aldolase
MFAGWELSKIAEMFPEVYRYTRVAPNVPPLPAISHDLANATFIALAGSYFSSTNPCDWGELSFDIVGQDRHGVCAVGGTPWEAYEHVERLDHVCEMVLKSGVKPNGIF